MKVWSLVPNINSMVIGLKNFDDDSDKVEFNGEPILNWEAIEMKTHKKNKLVDFPHFLSNVLVMSEKARNLLNDFFSDYTQFLPIKHGKQTLFFINVTTVIDCLDYSRTEYVTMPSGKISHFKRLYFNKDMVKNRLIFKTPEFANKRIFVTDKMKEIIEKSNLEGIEFNLEWDSDITKEIERKNSETYEKKIFEIDQREGKKYTWSEAIELLEHDKALTSGKWKIQKNKQGTMLLGQLTFDFSYLWMNPIYLPPSLLDLQWKLDEKADI